MMSTECALEQAALRTSEGFELVPIPTKTGRWRARLWYLAVQGATKVRTCSVILAEPIKGGIVMDAGSRGRGGRKRLRTRDRQVAIYTAEKSLKKVGEALVARGIVERTLEVASGDLTIPQIASVYFNYKHPTKNNIGRHHANNMALCFDMMLELNGPDWTASQADQSWIDRMMAAQMHPDGIQFNKVKVMNANGEMVPRAPIARRDWNTARKIIGYFMGAVSLAHRTSDPHRPGKTYQEVDPFARPDVRLPKARKARRKRIVSTEHYMLMMMPVEVDGRHIPAPVDRVDPSGRARLLQATFYHHGVRRTQLRLAKREHLALTLPEVQRMIACHAPYLRVEDARLFEHGLWLYEGEQNKMGHKDVEHYTRVIPISQDHREEIDLYLARNPDVREGKHGPWLFPSAEDSREPVSDSTVFATPEWQWMEHGGAPVLDRTGKKVHECDEDGRWQIKAPGGWFHRAEEIIRDDLAAVGQEWIAVLPYQRGSLVHSWRGHLETMIETLGYVRSVQTEDGEINLLRHADYLLMRKMDDSVRMEHYIPLDAAILIGMVNMQEADEVLAERGMRRARETRAHLDQLKQARTRLRGARGDMAA